jgi:hypothetical protein
MTEEQEDPAWPAGPSRRLLRRAKRVRRFLNRNSMPFLPTTNAGLGDPS